MSGWVSPALEPDEHEKLLAIESGIPAYMRPQVVDWLMNRSRRSGGYMDEDVANFLSLAFKMKFPTYLGDYEAVLKQLSDPLLVSVVDWFLYHDVNRSQQLAKEIGIILDFGHSEWTVTDMDGSGPRITRRIPTGVETTYRDIISKTAVAGQLLVEAFNSVYGSNPNSDSAYGLSVKAVETLACPKYLPTSNRATLGSVIAHLSQKDVILPLLEGNVSDKDLIVSMMRKLWAGGERHGSETYQHVSADGAKVALALAFSLVSMLHEDVITVS